MAKHLTFSNHLFFNRYWFAGILTIILIGVLFLASPNSVRANTPVCGTISVNTVWSSSGNDYEITCDVQIASGVTLTIQSGTTVRFAAGTSLVVNGTLIAEDCTFTSSSLTPSPGEWGRIYFSPSSQDATFDVGGNYQGGSAIQNCLVSWGGDRIIVAGAIETNLASPYLYQNTIQYSESSAIHALGRSNSQRIMIVQNNLSYNGIQNLTDGAGIYVTSGNVISNTVTNNLGRTGGGIYAATSTVRGNSVTNNLATYEGGGIYAIGSAIDNNAVSANTNVGAGRGGGLYVNGGSVSGNTISGNSANSYGGGIYTPGSNVSGNTLSGNTATIRGGGIYAADGTFTDNTLDGNFSDDSGGGMYAVTGTINDNTFSNNSANIGGGIYASQANIFGNSLNANQASTDGGGIYVYDGGTVTDNNITGNSASRGAGIFAQTGANDDEVYISGNTVQNNDSNKGGGIFTTESTVTGNTLNGNHANTEGGGIYVQGGTVNGNTVTLNTVPNFGHGAGVYLEGAVEFTYNQVMTNTAAGGTAGGITINTEPATLELNNFFGNQPYEAEVSSTSNVDATLNYWGPISCTDIGGKIYDGNDAPGRGKLTYAPSLYSPIALTQLTSPSNLSIASQSPTTVTLTWTGTPAIPDVGCRDPQSSTADKSYFVYYETGTSCTFGGKGLPQGDSPIEVEGATSLMLTGLSNFSPYHFVVAAHDYLGRISPFSNAIIRPASGHQIYLPVVIQSP